MCDNSFEIRPITGNDLAEILEVYRQNEDFLALGSRPKASIDMVLQDMETSRQDKGIFCGIYDSAGRLRGIIDFIPCSFNGLAHVAFINLLMIIRPLRNQGIGTRILRLLERKIMLNEEIREIQTAVQLNNPAALRFWQRNNYRVFKGPEIRPDQTEVVYLRKDLVISH